MKKVLFATLMVAFLMLLVQAQDTNASDNHNHHTPRLVRLTADVLTQGRGPVLTTLEYGVETETKSLKLVVSGFVDLKNQKFAYSSDEQAIFWSKFPVLGFVLEEGADHEDTFFRAGPILDTLRLPGVHLDKVFEVASVSWLKGQGHAESEIELVFQTKTWRKVSFEGFSRFPYLGGEKTLRLKGLYQIPKTKGAFRLVLALNSQGHERQTSFGVQADLKHIFTKH